MDSMKISEKFLILAIFLPVIVIMVLGIISIIKDYSTTYECTDFSGNIYYAKTIHTTYGIWFIELEDGTRIQIEKYKGNRRNYESDFQKKGGDRMAQKNLYYRFYNSNKTYSFLNYILFFCYPTLF